MNEAGELASSFWRWLDILDLNTPPAQPFTWIPDRFWWWWRASRVIQDYDMAFGPREIINEFPFFSFLLADLHPHILAIPFALLCISLALHILLRKESDRQFTIGPIHISLTPAEMLLAAIITGAMGFLNTWDFPIYVGFIAALVAFRQSAISGDASLSQRLISWGRDFGVHGLALGITGILLYLPFYISFSSQAGGLILNLIYPTRGAQLWVMFGGLFMIMGIFLFFLVRQEKSQSITNPSWKTGFFISLGLLASFWFLTLLMGAFAFINPELRSFYLGSLSASDPFSIFSEAIVRRWIYAGGWLTLLLILVPTLTLLLRSLQRSPQLPESLGKAEVFVLFLILFGSLLVIIPEFVFLRDQFGWRMNTIFKFYYQAWILWAIASAAGAVILLITLKGRWRLVYQAGLGLIIVTGLVYPILSLPGKTNQISFSVWGLDGEAYLESQNPNEYAAIQWLKQAPYGVIAEAVSPTGGSYTGYARAATISGLPGVLGWMGHESQWRGSGEAMGSRQADLARLFCSRDPNEINEIIQKYQIRYIFSGALERLTYTRGSENCPTGFNEAILQEILDPIYQAGDVTVYTIPGQR
jgi:YYY domain-containing protein